MGQYLLGHFLAFLSVFFWSSLYVSTKILLEVNADTNRAIPMKNEIRKSKIDDFISTFKIMD